MDGLTFSVATNFPINFKLKPQLLNHHHYRPAPTPSLPPLHLLKLFPLSLSNPNPVKSFISLSLANANNGGASCSNDEPQALDITALRSTSVRLIDENHNMVGVVSKTQAREMAQDAELDLVIVAPDADPPVVKMMDYEKFVVKAGVPFAFSCLYKCKYKYELQKKKKEQQKKSSANQMITKELKMGYNIDQHDYSVRLKAAQKFLKDGDKVKVVVNLKGRENEFRNIAIELIKRFQSDVGEFATEETKSFRDRKIFIVMVPNKVALQKTQPPSKKTDKSTADAVPAGVQS